ncbi:hypothetical protein LEMLEM_LOCUS17123 [Lemmus lemmus]
MMSRDILLYYTTVSGHMAITAGSTLRPEALSC